MIGRTTESETQWQVTWFPPDRSEVVRTGTERQVLAYARANREWAPIVERREITVGPWEIVDPDAPAESNMLESDDAVDG